MNTYVITLEFEEYLTSQINILKDLIYKNVGEQQYLFDIPHLTLYISEFQNFIIWEKDYLKFLESLIFDDFTIKIDDWVEFKNDVITKKHTIACGISNIHKLQEFQKQIIEFLNQFRDKTVIIDRFHSNFSRFNDIEKENIMKYGFPFVGDIWVPHITLASVNKDDYKPIKEKLKNQCPKGSYKLKSIDIQKLTDADKMQLVNQFLVKQC